MFFKNKKEELTPETKPEVKQESIILGTLTEEEYAEKLEIFDFKVANNELLDQLLVTRANLQKQEREWWNKIAATRNISYNEDTEILGFKRDTKELYVEKKQ